MLLEPTLPTANKTDEQRRFKNLKTLLPQLKPIGIHVTVQQIIPFTFDVILVFLFCMEAAGLSYKATHKHTHETVLSWRAHDFNTKTKLMLLYT